MDALAFLDAAPKAKRQPMYAVFGDEEFLKRLCRDAVVRVALGDADPSFALSYLPGDKLDFSTVRNELDTLPFVGPCRVVVVDGADPFVTANRDALEKYAAAPSKVGVLVLDVKTFPENTKLAKALPDAAKLDCRLAKNFDAVGWAVKWAPAHHGKKLPRDAAELLVDLVGPQLGLLDQELAKLAVAAGSQPAISAEDVDRLVGRTRAANVFKIMDAVGDGKPGAALGIVAELFEQGEDAFSILGPLSSQLRKLATVHRRVGRGEALGPAMSAAGVPNYPPIRQAFERQLRHLGRDRLDRLTALLMETTMGLRGDSPLPPRVQVERLLVRLARPK